MAQPLISNSYRVQQATPFFHDKSPYKLQRRWGTRGVYGFEACQVFTKPEYGRRIISHEVFL